MPTYNDYTKTNDFPLQEDFWPIDTRTGRKKTPLSMSAGEKFNARNKYNDAIKEWIKKYNIPQSVIDEWNKLAAQQFDDATAKSFWKRMSEKVSNTIDNFINKAEQVLKNAGENVLLAPLLPFKTAMVNALKRKGENVNSKTPLGEIASLFKQKIVDRKSSTNYVNHFDITPEQIMLLIGTILPFFTAIIERVKSGKASEDERLMNSDAENDANKINSGGQPTSEGVNAPVSSENWFSKYKFLIIGVAVVVLFIAFRKKK